jgi:hypothetical protein
MRSDRVPRFRTYVARLCALAVLAISFIAPIHAQSQSPANNLPAGNGKDIVAIACTQCHGLKLIVALRDGPVGWKHFVDDMVLRGAQLSPQEADTVAQYLAKNFGPGTSPMQSGLKTEALCHDLGRITTVGRSKDEWNSTVGNMMARAGTNVATQDEVSTMASYLASNFGKRSN